MKVPSVQTECMILRGYSPDDLSSFRSMLSNRGVVRYLPRGDPWPIEIVEKWLHSQKAHWAEEGFGWWILEHKIDSSVIGWCGLRRIEQTEEVEILCLIDEPYWGKGLATETTKFSVEFGFNIIGLTEIIGLVHEHNNAARKVLEKSGLGYMGRAHYFGFDCLKYKIRKVGFENRRNIPDDA